MLPNSTMRVLIADDVYDTLELYSLIFHLEGFHVEKAADGEEAVEIVRESTEPFDVVVLDVQMPRMDGWQVLKAIRKMPQGQHLPVIMFSAFAQDLHARAIASGANAGLDKPAAPQELVDMMRREVERAKSRTSPPNP
jgi:CheY-like chemotaxis protein